MAPQPTKILLVDDDLEFVKVYETLLTRSGFLVFTAIDGEEAIAIAEEKKPDLIILDVMMPKKDGFTATKEIRATAWGKNIPIIIFTGKEADEQRIKNISETEPTCYLVKGNASLAELVLKIKDLTRPKA